MIFKIQEQTKFQSDLQRFQTGVSSAESSVKAQGDELLTNLMQIVRHFDNTGVILNRQENMRIQSELAIAKNNMEAWMKTYASNVST